jgi:hypothetical protein
MYIWIIVAMVAAFTTGLMAKEGKDESSKNDDATTANANHSEPDKKTAAEEKEDRMATMLERIKEKDAARYKSLIAFKKIDKTAFEIEMELIILKYHTEAGNGKDDGKGKDEEKCRGRHPHGPRPYPNQLDRLPERGPHADVGAR